jgi:hopene-associated glycosyltransferase HpnB
MKLQPAMLLAASASPVLIWLYLLLGRGRFWQVQRHLPPRLAPPKAGRRVAVVIPARNEADVVALTVSSLLTQEFNGELHIFLVDDASIDGTAAQARSAAERIGQQTRLTLVEAVLREGWTGKMSAVTQGVERALLAEPDYLLLTDADIEHDPGNVSRLVALADKGNYDLVSLMVKLETRTIAEKALMPAFVFFFFLLYPPAWIADPRRNTAGAAGGCMLVRPSRLRRAGGIAAIRAEIIDDCALARIIKQAGGCEWLGLAEHTRSTRSYGSFTAIGRMISRTAFNQLGHSPLLLALTLIGLAVTYLLPVAFTLYGKLPYSLFGAEAWLLLTAAYTPMITFYRRNPLWTLILPTVAVFYAAATVHSAVKFWLGRGGQWKGRVQDSGSKMSL